MDSRTPRAIASSSSSSSLAPSHPTPVTPPSAETARAAVRDFTLQMKIACDELHDDPFDTNARDKVVQMILQDSRFADAALDRLTAHSAR